MKAKIEIRIWSDDEQPDTGQLAEMFQSPAECVAQQLSEGYVSGQIIGDGFTGWWEIVAS